MVIMREPGLTFRPPDAWRRARSSFFLWSLFPLFMFLMAVSSGRGAQGFIFPSIVLAIIAIRSWRISQMSVSIYSDRLVIRNILRTYRIPWSQVTQIGLHLTAPPEDLLRGVLGLPPDEERIDGIPEHRRIFDDSDGVTKFLLALYVSTARKKISVDAPTADLVEALAVAWGAVRDSRNSLVPSPSSEWDKVISADELFEWFNQESPPNSN